MSNGRVERDLITSATTIIMLAFNAVICYLYIVDTWLASSYLVQPF